jgi:Tol biopolymer transport system component/predicted Ser/Thr protein kinase
MTLAPGTKLGPYEILAPLGAGGMGEVYRARDTRLERTVAIKVLPQHLSENAEVRLRFEREAKTISQLSHPHICALYDVGNQDGVEFLVMEYLEGETLSDRLLKGPLAFEQVLRFGVEMADALDKAHRQGIVHRDLKPGNVMLTKSGVKLLDFGLAKAVETPSRQPVLTSFPTVAGGPALTQEGTILGTFQYMPPEQLEGKEADARTDIFAFGAVLYEMATGRKAFSGGSQASLISAIMGSEPPAISTVAPMTPPALDRVVRTCLSKDPDDRFQTAHDAKLQLQWIAEGGSQAGLPAPVVARRKNREKLAWAIAAAAILAAGLAAFGYLRRAPAEAFRMRSFLLPPEKSDFELGGVNGGSLTISPDGRQTTFAAKGPDGKVVLWLRSLGDLTAKPIAGTEGATFPFWSPDGRFLAFFADGKLKKVDISGSPPLDLCDAPNGRSGGWSRDGVILFSPDTTTALSQVPAAGGAPAPATKLDTARGETTHRWATFLPDGKHFLYMAGSHGQGTKSESNAIYVGTLGSKEKTLLLQARSNVVYASGYLLYVRERVLLAQRFDAGSRRFTGDPIQLAKGVSYDTGFFRGVFSVSENGLLVHGAGAGDTKSRLRWFDRAGKPIGEPIGEAADYQSLEIAPDGSRIAASINDPGTGTPDIWVFDSRGVRTRLTFGSLSTWPVWSPDGARIAYSRLEKQIELGIYVKSASGAGQEEALYRLDGLANPSDWSRDGRFLALNILPASGKTKIDIWILPLSGDRKPHPFVATEFEEYGALFSPDGRWVSYKSSESGKPELYVVPFPGLGGKWQISTGGVLGGAWWVKGGREIIYVSSDSNFVSVEVMVGASGLEIGPPRVLFNSPGWAIGDVWADGNRFLGAVFPEGGEKPKIALVANWTAGLAK